MKIYKMKSKGSLLLAVVVALCMGACGGGSGDKESKGKFAPPPVAKPLTFEEAKADWKNQKGLGPVTNVDLGELDDALAARGKEIYELKCTACHSPENEKLGPAPKGILERRTPEWIMNMILNPEEMAMKDPIGRGLLTKYNTVMANQGLSQDDARAVLEYFRTLK
ncbi:MAG: cytochrome c [Cyclobacteriaceae bacterium]|nr:cytochrome c [Cyclobacteriaceae bacterium]